jgi:plastocyanin
LGLLAIAAVALIGAVSADAGLASRAATPTTAVQVLTTTYHFRLSRQSVPAGRVVFTVINKSNATIDFKIANYATPKLRPGQRYVLHTRFTKPGRYTYFASGQYAELGLVGVLVVRRAG